MSPNTKTQRKNTLFDFVFLFFSVAVYSFTSVFIKLASQEESVFQFQALFYLACAIGILGAYAVLWQLVLKRFELSVAYSAKPFSTILTMIWGVLFFGEINFSEGFANVLSHNWNKFIGAAVILTGMWVVMKDHE